MSRFPLFRLTIAIAVFFILIAVFGSFLSGYVYGPAISVIKTPLSLIYGGASSVRENFADLFIWRILSVENRTLREENDKLRLNEIRLALLEKENIELREALELKNNLGISLLEAGSYGRSLDGTDYRLLINKGIDYSIGEDDAVISPNGVLIGKIKEVYGNYSVVSLVNNADFRAGVAVGAKAVLGVAEGNYDRGLLIDFIDKTEDIKEGDIVVTTGNDIWPKGLLVGEISHVSSEGSGLFSTVRAIPAIFAINLNKVFVVRLLSL